MTMENKNLLFVITGPSGSGKATVINGVLENFPEIKRVVTYTTRSPRPKEREGYDYRFISKEEFFAKVEDGSIFEYEDVYNDYYYGSPSDIFTDANYRIVELDYKGYLKYRKKFGDKIVSIFLVPPSLQELKERIVNRSKVSNLSSRLENAVEQLRYAREYDYVVLNDEIDACLKLVYNIIRTEIYKREQIEVLKFVDEMIKREDAVIQLAEGESQ